MYIKASTLSLRQHLVIMVISYFATIFLFLYTLWHCHNVLCSWFPFKVDKCASLLCCIKTGSWPEQKLTNYLTLNSGSWSLLSLLQQYESLKWHYTNNTWLYVINEMAQFQNTNTINDSTNCTQQYFGKYNVHIIYITKVCSRHLPLY